MILAVIVKEFRVIVEEDRRVVVFDGIWLLRPPPTRSLLGLIYDTLASIWSSREYLLTGPVLG